MNDQGCFELAGDLKCPNCRYWSKERPKEISKRPLQGVKVTLWCSAVRVRAIRRLFLIQTGTNTNCERRVIFSDGSKLLSYSTTTVRY